MKKGEKPEFSANWWKGSQPKDMKSAGGLESALKSYESAKGKLKSSGSGDDADVAAKALSGIEKAAKAVIAEASSAKPKADADMAATADCLKKFDYGKEHKWIDQHVEEGMFSDPDVYKLYLKTALKKLKRMSGVPGDDTDEDDESGDDDIEEGDIGKGMNFGLVLGKKAEQHRMALHKTKAAKALGGMLANETGIRKFTFGVARPSENVDELVLQLQGPQLPGMGKKGTRMLNKFKPLPFKTIVLMDKDGNKLEDENDPDDTDTDDDLAPGATAAEVAEADARAAARAKLEATLLRDELPGLIRRIQGLVDPALKGEVARMASQANALLHSNSLEEAKERIDQLRAALDQASRTANGDNGAAPVAPGSSNTAFAKSGEIWKATVAKVGAELEKLRAGIVDTYQTADNVGDLEGRYRAKVSGVLTALDDSLVGKLSEVAGAPDMTQRARLIGEARGIMEGYRSYVASEPLLADLDDNPFVPLTIRQTVSNSLSALEKVVH